MLPPTGTFSDPLAKGGMSPVGESWDVFLFTGDLDACFVKILEKFASLFGQPDKLI